MWCVINLSFAPIQDIIRIVIAFGGTNFVAYVWVWCQIYFRTWILGRRGIYWETSGYNKIENEHKVYKLKKTLDRLKQGVRAWYIHIEAYFLKFGFLKCPYEHSLFVKIKEFRKMLIVCRGDIISVSCLHTCFMLFLKSPGLVANINKISVYFWGVKQSVQDQILIELRFFKGDLPFRYLGVLKEFR